MEINFLAILVAALATLPIGFIWYNPKVFGTIWMKETGMTEEKAKRCKHVENFRPYYLVFIYDRLYTSDYGYSSIWRIRYGRRRCKDTKTFFHAFMADYGHAYRTFKHGMLHGFIAGLFLALPIVGINALFERKSWKIYTYQWRLLHYLLNNYGRHYLCLGIIKF